MQVLSKIVQISWQQTYNCRRQWRLQSR